MADNALYNPSQSLHSEGGEIGLLVRRADSIGEGRGDSSTLEEAPLSGGRQSDDDNTTKPDKANDSREPSRLFKDKQILDDAGKPGEDLDSTDYGPKTDPLKDKHRHQDPQKTLRGSKMADFVPSKKTSKDKKDKKKKKDDRCWEGYEPVPSKEPYSEGSCRKESKRLVKKAQYTVKDVEKIDPQVAQVMKQRGIYKVDSALFDQMYAEAVSKKKADHAWKMSDSYREENAGAGATVEYYDNWDVEWTLYKATDYVKKGSKVGVYKSANDAAQAAHAKDGNYVIEGVALRDGSYWGYYVVSVVDGKRTRYQKKFIKPMESGITHHKTAAAVLVDIPEEKFMADSVTAGRVVRARLSKRASRALTSLYKAGNRVQSMVSVGQKQFPQVDDRKAVRAIMSAIDEQFGKLAEIVDMMDPEEREEVLEEMEDLERKHNVEPASEDDDMGDIEMIDDDEDEDEGPPGPPSMPGELSQAARKAVAALRQVKPEELSAIASMLETD